MNQNQVFCEDTFLQNGAVSVPAIGNLIHDDELIEEQILTSSAGNVEHPDWFIQEYPDGRRILVSIDASSGDIHFVRQL